MSRRGTNLTTSQDIMEILVITATKSIVFFAIVILVEVRLQPLAELEVVKIAGLDQFGHIDVTLDTVLVEGLLEDFVVLDELMLVLCTPLDSFDWESARVESVEYGAVNGTSSTLLNLGKLQLRRVENIDE